MTRRNDSQRSEPPAAEGKDPFAFLDRLGQDMSQARAARGAAARAEAVEGATAEPAADLERQKAALQSALHRLSETGPAPEVVPGSHDSRRFGAVFAFLLVLVTLLAPIPIGSNRPLPWAGIVLLVGTLGLAYTLINLRRASAPPLRLRGAALIVAVALLQPLWGLVQALPLGDLGRSLNFPVALPEVLRPKTISIDPTSSLIAALRMAGNVAFFVLAFDLMSRPERLLSVMRLLYWGIVGYALYGLAALVLMGDIGLWGPKEAYHGFATGPFTNRNSFASFLGMGMVLGTALAMELRLRPKMRRPRRHGFLSEAGLQLLVYQLGFVVLSATLLATGSRMGLFASMIGVIVTFMLARRGSVAQSEHREAPSWQRALPAIAVITGLGALAVLFGTGLIERGLFIEQSLQTRLDIFRQAWDLILQRPLLGYGLDAFPRAFEIGRPDSFLDGFVYTDAHSTYLENWAEGGLIFGSAPLLAGGLYLLRLRHAMRSRGPHIAASAAAAGVVALAAVHSLVDFSFEVEANLLLLCLICAMGISQLTVRRQH